MKTTTQIELSGKIYDYTDDEKAAMMVLLIDGLLKEGKFRKLVLGSFFLFGIDEAVSKVLPEGNSEILDEMRQEFPETVVRDAIMGVAENLSVGHFNKSIRDLSDQERRELTRFVLCEW